MYIDKEGEELKRAIIDSKASARNDYQEMIKGLVGEYFPTF